MNEEQQNATFSNEMATVGKESHWRRDKNLRDVFVHLYEWHQLLVEWINANQSGNAKPFLPLPYNWKTYSAMNVEFCEKHQKTMLIKAKEILKSSHKDVVTLVETFSNEELFTKNVFVWTGTLTLGSYCVSAT